MGWSTALAQRPTWSTRCGPSPSPPTPTRLSLRNRERPRIPEYQAAEPASSPPLRPLSRAFALDLRISLSKMNGDVIAMAITKSDLLVFSAGWAAGAAAYATYPRWKHKLEPLLSGVVAGAAAAFSDARSASE